MQKAASNAIAELLRMLFVICVIGIGAVSAYGQLIDRVTTIAEVRHRQGWIRFHEDTAIDGRTIFTDYADQFGLSSLDSMELVSSKTDNLGYTHYRYQQYHGQVPIEGGMFLVHQKGGRAVKANGKIVSLLSLETRPHLTKHQAMQLALAASPSRKFTWLNPAYEQWLKSTTADTTDTTSLYLPEPQLLFTKTFDSLELIRGNLTLAYVVPVPTTDNNGGYQVYINALTGAVLRMVPLARGCTEATAETIFNGEQTIYTLQDGTNYVLTDDCQTTTIETRAYNTNGHEAVEHTSTDWTTDASLKPYTSAHWCGEQAYHYFNDVHGYDDYSAYNDKMLLVVGGNEGLQWWSDPKNYIQIGDTRNKVSYDWAVCLDIIGHEWAHALTDATANLLYFGEHGALFESFGFIFGEALEWYVKNTSPTNLTSGLETMYVEQQKDLCASGTNVLDTYCDDNWETATTLHARSGVQNRWFCLLVNGGTGTNDHCCSTYTYDVTAIGLEKAAKIAFRNMDVYLTRTSNHVDARLGALEATDDLYGQNTEYTQVTEAWNAVGVYDNEVAWDYLLCGELGGTKTYQAMHEIRTNKDYCGGGDVVIDAMANIEFFAGKSVRLQKGFKTENGCYFRARISSDICADMFPKAGVMGGHYTGRQLRSEQVSALSPLLLIFPNPITGTGTVRYRTYSAGQVSVRLIDALGAVVANLEETVRKVAGTYEVEMDVHALHLAHGSYRCLLTTVTGVVSQLLVVQ